MLQRGYSIRRAFPTALLAALFLLLCGACGPGDVKNRDDLLRRSAGMDIAVVLLDAAAADHFSFLGYARETTPFLSELATESVIFENAYAQASATPLSVYSLFTGNLPLVESLPVLDGEIQVAIARGAPTLASRLASTHPQRAGFSGNRWIGADLGYDQGFGEFVGSWELSEDLSRGATLLSDRALEWVAQLEESPFFLYLHYLEPHLPYSPPEPYASLFDPEFRGHILGTTPELKPFRRRRPSSAVERNVVGLYDGNLAYVDSEIRRVVDSLRKGGRWDSTIFVLLSDHGEAFWQHGVRGHGLHTYEEMIRVPLFVRIPGLPARRVAETVQLIDLLPTLIELSGNAPAGGAGQSLVSLLVGDASGEDGRAFARNHEVAPIEFALREAQWKWVRSSSGSAVRLYDLSADPDERINLQSHRDPATQDRTAPLAERFAARLDSLMLSQIGQGPAAEVDSLDADARERLRAMGYFH